MTPITSATLHQRDRESFRHAKEISLPYGHIENVLLWCRHQTRDDNWRWQLVEPSSPTSNGRYCFFFDDSQDFTEFLLRWG
jgi:hypothetical protein